MRLMKGGIDHTCMVMVISASALLNVQLLSVQYKLLEHNKVKSDKLVKGIKNNKLIIETVKCNGVQRWPGQWWVVIQ